MFVKQNDEKCLLDKLIFTAAMSWLAGNPVQLTFEGTKTQLESIKRVFEATREFILELHNPQATSETVMESLKRKQLAAKDVEQNLGIEWLF